MSYKLFSVINESETFEKSINFFPHKWVALDLWSGAKSTYMFCKSKCFEKFYFVQFHFKKKQYGVFITQLNIYNAYAALLNIFQTGEDIYFD